MDIIVSTYLKLAKLFIVWGRPPYFYQRGHSLWLDAFATLPVVMIESVVAKKG